YAFARTDCLQPSTRQGGPAGTAAAFLGAFAAFAGFATGFSAAAAAGSADFSAGLAAALAAGLSAAFAAGFAFFLSSFSVAIGPLTICGHVGVSSRRRATSPPAARLSRTPPAPTPYRNDA